jgi:hypothetical protein
MTMSGVKKLRALLAALAVLFLLNSCAEFFSTSWGEAFRRDPKKVAVSPSNVYDLLDTAKGDPELSRAILDAINADSDDALKRAAIKAANQAVGISTLALENVDSLIAAADKGDTDALKTLAENIINDLRSNDVEGIGAELTEILKDKVASPASHTSKETLINAKGVTTTVSKAVGGGVAEISIVVDQNGVGTATITGGGTFRSYPCVINEDGTITLTGAGENGGNAVIGYVVDDSDNTVTLAGLDAITDTGLRSNSNPSEKLPPGKPTFEEGFVDSVPESDLALLVMTLIMAKAEKERTDGTLDDYLGTWPEKNVETGKGLDNEELVIAAIVNVMVDRGDDMTELTNMIKDLLGVAK